MVASRFVRPGSKLKIFEYWQKRFYPEMLVGDIALHQLYRALTVAEARRALQKVRSIPVQIKSATIWVRTDISGNAQKLFATIGLKHPAKALLYFRRLSRCKSVSEDLCGVFDKVPPLGRSH